MFIYFMEQVWTFSFGDSNRHNFRTDEVGRLYWEAWHSSKNIIDYQQQPHMVEGVDWLDY